MQVITAVLPRAVMQRFYRSLVQPVREQHLQAVQGLGVSSQRWLPLRNHSEAPSPQPRPANILAATACGTRLGRRSSTSNNMNMPVRLDTAVVRPHIQTPCSKVAAASRLTLHIVWLTACAAVRLADISTLANVCPHILCSNCVLWWPQEWTAAIKRYSSALRTSVALHTLALYCTPLPCRECGFNDGCGSNSTSCSKATGRSSGSRLQPWDLVPSGGSCEEGTVVIHLKLSLSVAALLNDPNWNLSGCCTAQAWLWVGAAVLLWLYQRRVASLVQRGHAVL